VDECKLRGYSRKTERAYLFHMEKYLDSGLDPDKFLLKLIKEGKKRETVRLAGFAVKFYLRFINKNNAAKQIMITNLPNVKKEKRLPVILSKTDIKQMIDVTRNFVHRTIMQLMYSCGLRVSELVNLKWDNICFKRNLIHVICGKGGKDRMVMLSPKVKKNLLRLGSDKSGYVFMSLRDKKYSTATISKIVSNAAKKAGISQKVTSHTLRHCFATHLLEQGTDIRYIRDLLGHSRIETTMIYTHVSNKDISNIKSPLD